MVLEYLKELLEEYCRGDFKMFYEHYFEFPILGKYIKRYIIKKEGGEQLSKSLRSYVKNKYNVDVGLYTYGAVFSDDFNIGGVSITVGRYCSFASDINYYGANHPYNHFSSSPYFYNKLFGLDVTDVNRHSLNIGHDVWIGARTIITCGCNKIGNGAVIGAGSIVTKDVPPYTIVAGAPARIIKIRFDKETSDLLETSKWFALSPNQLMEFYSLKNNPRQFAQNIIKKYGDNIK